MWIKYNPNPMSARVGDCAVRAVSKATDSDWDTAYVHLILKGFELCDMPNANHVFGSYLREKGFQQRVLPDDCPACYTVNDFCRDHPRGVFVLIVNNHVVTVSDGDYYDVWESGGEPILYYWERMKK